MKLSTILCIASYLMIALSPSPIISLIGCGICGISVGIMWPGTLSKASAALRNGGTALFGMLALAGDFGCTSGPTVTGMVSDIFGGNMKAGFLAVMIFPIGLIICLTLKRK